VSIRIKILLSIIATTFLTAIVTGLISISSAKSLTKSAEEKFISEANGTIKGYMKDMESSIERAALMAAADKDVIAGLAEYLKTGNRDKIKNATLEVKQYCDADFLTVIDMKGGVVFRSHQPEKFGDSNADLDHVKAALSGRQTVAYETTASNPLALRCGAPIKLNGEQIGLVSGGYNLARDAFVDKLKLFTGAEVTIFLGDTRIMTTVLNANGERNIGTKAAENVTKQVFAGQDYIGAAIVAGKNMYTYYSPIRNPAGKVLGMTFTGMDITDSQHQLNATVTIVIIVMVSFVVIGVFIGLYIANGIAKPLKSTVDMLNEMSLGHLNARLRLDRRDEIGVMAKTMDMFADDLQNNVVKAMKRISVGDLDMTIEPKDSRDEVNDALKNTVKTLRKLIIDDGGRVLQAAADKDLSQRLKREYSGAFDKMKSNINALVENLGDALGQVKEAVSQVSNASAEISSGAQNLAESANKEASSLEEVSSSLEEMSSMTKQNADNSNQAKILAKEAHTAAAEGDTSMKRMADAINQIKASADNTAKIVKSIDDIAFQTNLLALNAAVEAARAGEAGKGFAVVAEEVRNLAMRSAEAAKNTADMIEESVKNADGGVKITEEVAKSLDQIVDRVGKVGGLIAEIAAASNEQAQGIEQVNTAVTQMNQVTQSNAANSEESASAAEELSGQAAELSKMVSAFKLGETGGVRPAARIGSPPPRQRVVTAAIPDKTSKPKIGPKPAKAVNAEEVIPLDDNELNDF
jgi:methyl-accepting chemotaxis protein